MILFSLKGLFTGVKPIFLTILSYKINQHYKAFAYIAATATIPAVSVRRRESPKEIV